MLMLEADKRHRRFLDRDLGRQGHFFTRSVWLVHPDLSVLCNCLYSLSYQSCSVSDALMYPILNKPWVLMSSQEQIVSDAVNGDDILHSQLDDICASGVNCHCLCNLCKQFA